MSLLCMDIYIPHEASIISCTLMKNTFSLYDIHSRQESIHTWCLPIDINEFKHHFIGLIVLIHGMIMRKWAFLELYIKMKYMSVYFLLCVFICVACFIGQNSHYKHNKEIHVLCIFIAL